MQKMEGLGKTEKSTFDQDAGKLVFDLLEAKKCEIEDKGIGEVYLIIKKGPFNNRAQALRHLLEEEGELLSSI